MFATKSLFLIRYARRAHLSALLEETIPIIPAVLEHPVSRVPMERIARALRLAEDHGDILMFPLMGFINGLGSDLTETNQLGALGAGAFKWIRKGDRCWEQFAVVDYVAQEEHVNEIVEICRQA